MTEAFIVNKTKRVPLLNKVRLSGMHKGNDECMSSDGTVTTDMSEVAERFAERLRPSWVAAVVKESRTAAGKILLADAEEAQRVLKEFVEALPSPANHAESLVLRGVLLEMASRTGLHVHAYAHRMRHSVCGFVSGAAIESFWSVPTDSPQQAFMRWMDEFFTQLARAHPRSGASQVARVLREQYQRAWPIPALARSVHATPSQLSRQFRREFGLSIPDYQRIVRLIHALDLVGNEKTEAVALEVGYKSKKNFYATLQHFTGLTPTEFRRLSDTRASEIIEMLALSLRRHGIAHVAHNEKA